MSTESGIIIFLTFKSEKQNDSNIDNHIHIFWYVIQAPGGRVTKTDLRIINTFPKENTLIILSKTDIAKPEQLESIRAVLKSGTIRNENIIYGGISEDRIIETTELKAGAKGICALYEKSLKKIVFEDANSIKDIENKKYIAKSIILGAKSSAAIATPIVLSNADIIIPIQVDMISNLADLYKLNKEQLKHQASPLIAQVVAMHTASSIKKLIFRDDSIINYTTLFTEVLGWFIQEQFEKMAIAKVKGENPDTLNIDFAVFEIFLENYKKNQKY